VNENDQRRDTALAELDRVLAGAVLTGPEERSVLALRAQDAPTISGVAQLLWAVRLAEASRLTATRPGSVAVFDSDSDSAEPVIPIRRSVTDSGHRPPVGVPGDPLAFRRELGLRLRDLRVRVDLSQRALAERAGVTRNFVGGVERGVQHLDAWRIWLLSRALQVSPGVLLLEEPAEAGFVQRSGVLPGVPR
jgi:DNA-binding XRE family transcriptional regulator